MKKARYWGQAIDGMIAINCPGCGTYHHIWIAKKPGVSHPVWNFNGDFEKPTLSPSLLVKTGKYANPVWFSGLSPELKADVEKSSVLCHSFVKNGFIEFLSDSTHALAGKTVELPMMPDRASSAEGS